MPVKKILSSGAVQQKSTKKGSQATDFVGEEMIQTLNIHTGTLSRALDDFKKVLATYQGTEEWKEIEEKLIAIEAAHIAKQQKEQHAHTLDGFQILTSPPQLIIDHQAVISQIRQIGKTPKEEALQVACNTFLADAKKIQFLLDPHGDPCIYFPQLGIVQRMAYLRPGKMKKGSYDYGTQKSQHDHKSKTQYIKQKASTFFKGMPSEEMQPLIYKNTIDHLPKQFLDTLEIDMYDRGYVRKTKTHTDIILGYIAEQLGLVYTSMSDLSRDHRAVVRSYMYMTGAVGRERLNTFLINRKGATYYLHGDRKGQIEGRSMSYRLSLLCEDSSRFFSDTDYKASAGSIPLIQEIRTPELPHMSSLQMHIAKKSSMRIEQLKKNGTVTVEGGTIASNLTDSEKEKLVEIRPEDIRVVTTEERTITIDTISEKIYMHDIYIKDRAYRAIQIPHALQAKTMSDIEIAKRLGVRNFPRPTRKITPETVGEILGGWIIWEKASRLHNRGIVFPNIQTYAANADTDVLRECLKEGAKPISIGETLLLGEIILYGLGQDYIDIRAYKEIQDAHSYIRLESKIKEIEAYMGISFTSHAKPDTTICDLGLYVNQEGKIHAYIRGRDFENGRTAGVASVSIEREAHHPDPLSKNSDIGTYSYDCLDFRASL